MLTALRVLTILPRTDDMDVFVEAAQRTRDAWDNRIDFYGARVVMGPSLKVLDVVRMLDHDGDWMGIRMSALVQADEEIEKMFVEVLDR